MYLLGASSCFKIYVFSLQACSSSMIDRVFAVAVDLLDVDILIKLQLLSLWVTAEVPSKSSHLRFPTCPC